MRCPNCGTENNYYHRYCYNCGEAFQNIEIQENENDVTIEPAQIVFNKSEKTTEEPGQKSNRKVLSIVIYVAVAIAAIVLSVLIGRQFLATPSGANLSGSTGSHTTQPTLSSTISSSLPAPTPTSTLFPLSLELLNPASGSDSTESGEYAAKISTNGNNVYINGELVPAAAEAGTITLNLTLASFGKNTFTIKVESQDGQQSETTVVIDRLFPLMKLLLKAKQPLSTNKDSISIAGTTDIGGSLALQTDLEYQSPVAVDAKGNFNILFSLPVIPGIYPVTLTASAENHGDTTLTFNLERLLDEKAYHDAAMPVSYDDLMSGPDSFAKKVIRFSGTIDEVETTGDVTKFTFRVNNKSSQLVHVEYHGKTKMNKGGKRWIYGEYVGMSNGVPEILARLGYKITN